MSLSWETKQPHSSAVKREAWHYIWVLARQLALTDLLLSSASSVRARKMQGSDLAEGFPLATLYALEQAHGGYSQSYLTSKETEAHMEYTRPGVN